MYKTWELLDKAEKVPTLTRGKENPFVLADQNESAIKWFDDFMYYFEFGEKQVEAADKVSDVDDANRCHNRLPVTHWVKP